MKKQHFVWIHSIRFKQQIILLIILVFYVCCCALFYREASENSRNAVFEKMENQSVYYLNSLDNQIDGIIRQGANFYQERKLSYIANAEIGISAYEWREAVLSVQDRLFSLESANPLVKRVKLYAPFGGYVLTSSKAENYDYKAEQEYQKLCANMEEHTGKIFCMEEEYYLCLTQSIYNPNIAPTFLLEIQLDQQILISDLTNLSGNGGGAALTSNEEGYYIQSKGSQQLAEIVYRGWTKNIENLGEKGKITNINTDMGKYLIYCDQSKYLGRMIQYEPEQIILGKLAEYRTWFMVFVAASAGIIILFSGYTEYMINRPLKKLYQAFRVLEEGDMEIRVSHSAQDEFGYIYDGFNRMVHKLQQLIDQVYIQKNMTQKAELKQLQTQINPHFLYNSFFLLSGRIKRGDMEGAEEFSKYLGTYFQFLTRNTSDTVPLYKEVTHALAYARIQGARFAARIQVEVEELPASAENLEVPRLILQPLLENAFNHGLEDKEEDGILRMYYRENKNKFMICVENNGKLEEGTLDNLRERLSNSYKGEVTGMINIHRRLKIHYRGEGGLVLSKGQLGGLCIMVEIPREIKEGEDEELCTDY